MRRGLLPLLLLLAPAPGGVVDVRTAEELRRAIADAKPGTTIRVAAGDYAGGFQFRALRGEAERPIVIAGAERDRPPRILGGGSGLQLSAVAHVELRDLVFERASDNGINVDDGGDRAHPSHHVLLRRLRVADVGATGNQDGIKLSGVDDFRIEECTVERWGTGGGSAIDLVGCHRGVIEGSRFTHDGRGGSGVQAKGGSAEIVVRRNRFDRAGVRAVNLGGSTGIDYFRPPLAKPPHREASGITVEGNTFVGSDAPIAFVGVDGATVRFNTIHAPRRWAIRILQETTAEGFVPCRDGEFSRNIVAFLSTQWSEGGVNVGPGTDAASFRFADNWWYCIDAPERSRPQLPTPESSPIVGRDPKLRAPGEGDLSLLPDSPAKAYGAGALK